MSGAISEFPILFVDGRTLREASDELTARCVVDVSLCRCFLLALKQSIFQLSTRSTDHRSLTHKAICAFDLFLIRRAFLASGLLFKQLACAFVRASSAISFGINQIAKSPKGRVPSLFEPFISHCPHSIARALESVPESQLLL